MSAAADLSFLTQTVNRTATSSLSKSSSDSSILGNNLDTFLQILTTQLQTQSPIDPINTDEFTQQLTRFAEAEQSIRSNDLLEQILERSLGGGGSSVVGYLGQSVTVAGDRSQLGANGAQWDIDASSAASDTTFRVRDDSGALLYEEKGSLRKGSQSFNWDGTTSSGATAPEGSYKLEVTALDNRGNDVFVEIKSTATVTAIDMSGEEPVLELGGARYPVSDVLRIGLVQK